MTFDRAQLPSPLALTDSEFSWYIFEVTGASGRFAGLVSIHRTGPRVRSLELRPQLVAARDLPEPFRGLLPGWLPIVSPVRVSTDDRPLFMVALYDLDARAQPIVVEHEIEHADFDAVRFAATARGGELVLEVGDDVAIRIRDARFACDLRLRASKPAVMFGDGSPLIRHGDIATSYVQRPRLEVQGTIELDGRRCANLDGQGVHDHQWLRVTVPNLKWLWPHLRLPDGRELTGYVIRDSARGRQADADDGRELGHGGWIIERDGTVRPLARFDVRATAHIDTERGRVPTRFRVEAPELGLDLDVEHIVPAPFIPMRAFGDVLAGGIYEGPVDVRDHPAIRGWIEVMNASHVRVRSS